MEDIIARYRNERQDLHEKFTPGKDIASDKVSTQDLHLTFTDSYSFACTLIVLFFHKTGKIFS